MHLIVSLTFFCGFYSSRKYYQIALVYSSFEPEIEIFFFKDHLEYPEMTEYTVLMTPSNRNAP